MMAVSCAHQHRGAVRRAQARCCTRECYECATCGSSSRPRAGPVRAVAGVSFSLQPGERLGLVGESGSGKSTTILALLRMIRPPGRITGGDVRLDGVRSAWPYLPIGCARCRFSRISLIPQGAMSSLNPGPQGPRPDRGPAQGSWCAPRPSGACRSASALFSRGSGLAPEVAEPLPARAHRGGMKQRVCIAMAIALRPQVIIADEPTSALDVVVQKQVLTTLGEVQEEIGAAVILVGHDMGLMAQFAHRIGVMYAGRLVEIGPVRDIFASPRHPYTQDADLEPALACAPRRVQGHPGNRTVPARIRRPAARFTCAARAPRHAAPPRPRPFARSALAVRRPATSRR